MNTFGTQELDAERSLTGRIFLKQNVRRCWTQKALRQGPSLLHRMWGVRWTVCSPRSLGEMPYSSQVAVQSQEFEAGGNQDVLPVYSRKVLAQTAVTGAGEQEVSKDLHAFIQDF